MDDDAMMKTGAVMTMFAVLTFGTAALGQSPGRDATIRPILKSAVGENQIAAPSIRRGTISSDELWLDESRIAVFPREGAGRPELHRARPPGDAGIKDTRTRDGALPAGPRSASAVSASAVSAPAVSAEAATAENGSASKVSPVYVDRSGQPRALPGGVIVTLPDGLDEARARRLLLDQGLSPTRQLGPRLWLVDGPVGAGSLELAQRIADEGRFEAAEPNWWAPPVLKTFPSVQR